MRRTRVLLGALAATTALCLIPTGSASAALATTSCSSTATLQIGLLGAAIPTRPACSTPPIACPQGRCNYTVTGVISNGISVSSGVAATFIGVDHQGHQVQSSNSCNGGVSCVAQTHGSVGQPGESGGPSGAVGLCSWFGGPLVAVALGTKITCVLTLDSVQLG